MSASASIVTHRHRFIMTMNLLCMICRSGIFSFSKFWIFFQQPGPVRTSPARTSRSPALAVSRSRSPSLRARSPPPARGSRSPPRTFLKGPCGVSPNSARLLTHDHQTSGHRRGVGRPVNRSNSPTLLAKMKEEDARMQRSQSPARKEQGAESRLRFLTSPVASQHTLAKERVERVRERRNRFEQDCKNLMDAEAEGKYGSGDAGGAPAWLSERGTVSSLGH